MKSAWIIAAALILSGQTARAASCQEEAASKRLGGAALSSFMTKCEKDARVSCERESSGKRLSGAAKNSFETKCVNDAVGKSTRL
jgi:hypothetical protein